VSTHAASRYEPHVLAKKAQYKAHKLAALLHVSLRTLERDFKRACGPSPQAWLDQQRKNEQMRLACAGLQAKEIALQMGYRHSSSFCRRFKQDHGLTTQMMKHSKHFVSTNTNAT
jgi:AraC-like DNA-binding protein